MTHGFAVAEFSVPYRYVCCGLLVRSNVAFPGLSTTRSTPLSSIDFQVVEDVAKRSLPSGPLGDLPDWGAVQFWDLGDRYLLRVVELADFEISRDATTVYCFPQEGVSEEIAGALFLTRALPAILRIRGCLALHAGAIVVSGKSLVLVGSSGSGKSTLTSAFGRLGFDVLGDDCLVIKKTKGQLLATPSYPILRLHTDSACSLLGTYGARQGGSSGEKKVRVTAETNQFRFRKRSTPVSAILVLDPIPAHDQNIGITFDRFGPVDGFMKLLAHLFRVPQAGRKIQAREFVDVASITRTLPIIRLRYPHSFSLLPDVVETIRTCYHQQFETDSGGSIRGSGALQVQSPDLS